MASRPDARQPTFFDIPRPPRQRPGSMNFGAELRSALAKAIKNSVLSRPEIAARMNDLIYGEQAGEEGEVTVHMLNAWTAPSREGWRFPLEYLPAFVEATGAHWLVDVVAERCGCRALLGKEAALADIGAIRAKLEELKRTEQELTRRLDPSAAERLLKQRRGRP
jgi:hypothetical protein